MKKSELKQLIKECITEVNAKDKIYTIEKERNGRYYYQTGTLPELIKAYSYTLEKGKSWEREKGNKKININPTTIEKLVDNLYNAENNAAANGYSGYDFRVLKDGEEKRK